MGKMTASGRRCARSAELAGEMSARRTMPEEVGTLVDAVRASGLTRGRNPLPRPVMFLNYAMGVDVLIQTHVGDHDDIRRQSHGDSGYRRYRVDGTECGEALKAIARLATMRRRARAMDRTGKWQLGSRYPARFWMCDSVLRRLMDIHGVTPRALQWALGNAVGMTIGVPASSIGLRERALQGALLLHAPYGVTLRSGRTLPGSVHGFEMHATEDRVEKFIVKLSSTVTLQVQQERVLMLRDELLPQTVMDSLVGMRAYDVVRHHLLDVDDAVVTRCGHRDGSTVIHLTYGHAFVGDPE